MQETIILEMQPVAYRLKEEWKDKVRFRQQAETALVSAQKFEESALRKLVEVADFLQEHNSDANREGETWHSNLGIK